MSEIRITLPVLQHAHYPDSFSDMHAEIPGLLYLYYPSHAVSPAFLRSDIANLQLVYYPLAKPELRCDRLFLQYVIRAPEVFMSDSVFPAGAAGGGDNRMALRGTTYSVFASPQFKTGVAEHTGGGETATSYWSDPKWTFKLSFDWLPNRSLANSTDFKTLCGFFLARKGRFDTFLFRMPDDHHCDDVLLGTGNGTEIEFPVFRPMGEFEEPVGQVQAEDLDVYLTGAFSRSIPASGPYTVDFARSISTLTSISIGADTITDVSPATPANSMEYKKVGSVFTFHSSRASATAVFHCKFLATNDVDGDYVLLAPRVVTFNNAPAAGVQVHATFDFYFVCRFVEDQTEFEQFADRLWANGELEFRSVPQ